MCFKIKQQIVRKGISSFGPLSNGIEPNRRPSLFLKFCHLISYACLNVQLLIFQLQISVGEPCSGLTAVLHAFRSKASKKKQFLDFKHP